MHTKNESCSTQSNSELFSVTSGHGLSVILKGRISEYGRILNRKKAMNDIFTVCKENFPESLGSLENIIKLSPQENIQGKEIETSNFTNVTAGAYWKDVIGLLMDSCSTVKGDNANAARNFAHMLKMQLSNTDDPNISIGLKAVAIWFAEFLKNSTEAAATKKHDEVYIKISLEFDHDNVVIHISDQSGGFKEGFIDTFNAKVQAVSNDLTFINQENISNEDVEQRFAQNPRLLEACKNYIETDKADMESKREALNKVLHQMGGVQTDKKSIDGLGGCGLGLIRSYLDLTQHPEYDYKEVTTRFTISNVDVDGAPGARISLQCPIAALKLKPIPIKTQLSERDKSGLEKHGLFSVSVLPVKPVRKRCAGHFDSQSSMHRASPTPIMQQLAEKATPVLGNTISGL